ncbi:MAG: hypothetical protein RDV48_15590 [Candidatus Eremiobacteraeota bacterium]|nr:hypothetical protein [Candidatus Eremiobacteraeota bacterium]
MNELVCYCLEYREEDIIRDVIENAGRSLIMERIMAERQAGTCECSTRNPRGT